MKLAIYREDGKIRRISSFSSMIKNGSMKSEAEIIEKINEWNAREYENNVGVCSYETVETNDSRLAEALEFLLGDDGYAAWKDAEDIVDSLNGTVDELESLRAAVKDVESTLFDERTKLRRLKDEIREKLEIGKDGEDE